MAWAPFPTLTGGFRSHHSSCLGNTEPQISCPIRKGSPHSEPLDWIVLTDLCLEGVPSLEGVCLYCLTLFRGGASLNLTPPTLIFLFLTKEIVMQSSESKLGPHKPQPGAALPSGFPTCAPSPFHLC